MTTIGKFLVLFMAINLSWINASADETTLESMTSVKSQKKAPSAFSVTYFLIGGQTLNEQDNEMSSFDVFDSYLSFNYRINPDFRISARPTFGYALSGRNKFGDEVNDKARIRDFSFVAAFSNVAEDYLPASTSYRFAPRLYLPTSDGSKDEGMIARLRLENEFRWNFARFSDLRIYAKPSYYFQRTTAFIQPSNGRSRTTRMADSEHGVEVSYSLNKTFSIVPGLNFIENWSNSSDVNNIRTFRSSVVDYRLGLEVRATRDFSFTIGLQSEQDLIRTNQENEISYSVLTGGALF